MEKCFNVLFFHLRVQSRAKSLILVRDKYKIIVQVVVGRYYGASYMRADTWRTSPSRLLKQRKFYPAI